MAPSEADVSERLKSRLRRRGKLPLLLPPPSDAASGDVGDDGEDDDNG
jgi:hypothetical protein